MPLLDHFHPPLSVDRPWEGVHGAWAAAIAGRLNEELPEDYFALLMVTVGGQVEVDVGTFRERAGEAGNGTVATVLWAPPALTAEVDFLCLDAYEVRVMQQMGGPQLRAAIELVSSANKDRASHRQAFAVKCAAYLQRGVSVVVIDVVTERTGNLHTELARLLGLETALDWQSPSGLYGLAYRAARVDGRDRIEAWPEALAVGQPLPPLPLWLPDDLCVPLRLEETYKATCASLRIRV